VACSFVSDCLNCLNCHLILSPLPAYVFLLTSKSQLWEPQVLHNTYLFGLCSEAICSPETSVNLYQTTRRHIPEDSTLYSHLRNNHKSNVRLLILLVCCVCHNMNRCKRVWNWLTVMDRRARQVEVEKMSSLCFYSRKLTLVASIFFHSAIFSPLLFLYLSFGIAFVFLSAFLVFSFLYFISSC
jgi:hypothetical protein